MIRLPTFCIGLFVVALLLGVAAPVLADETQGKITAINPEKNQFVLTENFKDLTFQLSKDGKVFVNNQERKLSELQPGDDASVTFARQGQQLIANAVRCTRK